MGHRKFLPGIGVRLAALLAGGGGSFLLAAHWLQLSPGWLALMAGGGFSVLGAELGENLGDAIVFSLGLGVVVTVFLLAGPANGILRAGVVPVATGLCVGKLLAGVSREFLT